MARTGRRAGRPAVAAEAAARTRPSSSSCGCGCARPTRASPPSASRRRSASRAASSGRATRVAGACRGASCSRRGLGAAAGLAAGADRRSARAATRRARRDARRRRRRSSPGEGFWIEVARLDEVPPGTALRFSTAAFDGFVVNDGGRCARSHRSARTWAARCTSGPDWQDLRCPCHGASFDLAGRLANGRRGWRARRLSGRRARLSDRAARPRPPAGQGRGRRDPGLDRAGLAALERTSNR